VTTSAPPTPGGGSHFNGWSFFGGILLTLVLFGISFVGYKYYTTRVRSGGNYNQFQ